MIRAGSHCMETYTSARNGEYLAARNASYVKAGQWGRQYHKAHNPITPSLVN